MPLIIECCDAGIRTFLGRDLVDESPGFAVHHHDQLQVGTAGYEQTRLYPQWTNNRFWQQLDTAALRNPRPQVRHHADLAFAHLESIWQGFGSLADEVFLAVPGSFSREQIGLLAGMARECGMPLTGIVDSALAACWGRLSGQRAIYLDAGLHQISASLFTAGDQVARGDYRVLADAGLARLWDRAANVLAAAFIQQTRFDPMHDASSEQQLYNRIPGWIRTIGAAPSIEFELDWSGGRQRTVLSMEKLLATCADLYPSLVQQLRSLGTDTTTLFLSDRMRAFPGLQDSLRLLKGFEPVFLEPQALAETVLDRADEIRSPAGRLSHVLRLSPRAVQQKARARAPAAGMPTHLLIANLAHPIGRALKLPERPAAQWSEDDPAPVGTLYPRAGDLHLALHRPGMLVINGTAAQDGQVLATGDELTLGGQQMRLIQVLTEDL